MSSKTLAMMVLDGKKIPYQVYRYDADQRDAEVIARQLGLDPAKVFKTMVVTRAAGKPFLVMIPADRQLNLKQMAKAVGEKKVKMATQREAESMTGLQAGGISALALLNRGFVICLDASAQAHETIFVSAGERGIQLEAPVNDLISLTRARLISVS